MDEAAARRSSVLPQRDLRPWCPERPRPHLTAHPTFDTRGGAAAPGQVPLAGDDVGAADVISWLALVGEHAASHGGGVGRADPAKLDQGQGRAGVIGLNLCTESGNERN